MSTAVMNEIKDKINLLSTEEKAELTEFLAEMDDWDMQIAADIRKGNTANIDRAIAEAKSNGTLRPLNFDGQ